MCGTHSVWVVDSFCVWLKYLSNSISFSQTVTVLLQILNAFAFLSVNGQPHLYLSMYSAVKTQRKWLAFLIFIWKIKKKKNDNKKRKGKSAGQTDGQQVEFSRIGWFQCHCNILIGNPNSEPLDLSYTISFKSSHCRKQKSSVKRVTS